ncbi:MAG: hypothetical protein VW268_00510 [Rhodospirillaceae bacterium]
MKTTNIIAMTAFAFALSMPGLIATAEARDINDEIACAQATKDTQQAINENPELTDGGEADLRALMTKAETECRGCQYQEAKQSLEVARGMVASE